LDAYLKHALAPLSPQHLHGFASHRGDVRF
jgi:hypothetical protein